MMFRRMILGFILLTIIAVGAAPVQSGILDRQGNLSLQLKGVSVVDALNMIAEQNNLNLVISGEVQGEVTLRLDSVDVGTALDAILTAMGYTYYLDGNLIVVKSAALDVAAELISKTITLSYIEPITAQSVLEARLSDKGRVVILKRRAEDDKVPSRFHPNKITITERPNNMDKLLSLIAEIDQPERMVLIEVKIIETKLDNSTKLGLHWPNSLSADIYGAGAMSGVNTITTTTNDADEGGSAIRDFNTGSWTWGKLNIGEVGVVLDALLQDGNSKLLSDPRITTAENYEAVISTQTIIPIQTLNRFSEGGSIQDIVTFQDEEVGISVTVTPRITADGRITLDVHPVIEDIIGYTGSIDNQKPITSSRSIKTRVTVDNGETLVLGGLLKEGEISATNKVPLLGQIPLLGKILFSHKSVEKTTTDLTIMITPRIL